MLAGLAQADPVVTFQVPLKLVASNGGDGIPAYNATTTMFKAKSGTPLVVETKGTFYAGDPGVIGRP